MVIAALLILAFFFLALAIIGFAGLLLFAIGRSILLSRNPDRRTNGEIIEGDHSAVRDEQEQA